jgi:hypothetical protein
MTDEMVSAAIKLAIEKSADLMAEDVTIVRLKQDHDIDSDVSKVRVEMTFNVR